MAGTRLRIYVQSSANYPKDYRQSFELLGPVWEGEYLHLRFGEPPYQRVRTVVGWRGCIEGTACPIRVARARWRSPEGQEEVGVLVWGGNAGVRILDSTFSKPPTSGKRRYLLPGLGVPIIWVEDPADPPPEVRAVIEKEE